ncbi:MAG TPA: FtsX-like permease family protein [Catalimonadaceae bacterium]|nr:FtsX-like permease family protein [Catalimonadaceae bacterium]HPI10485.1 FtsX-like permease family protein [Catalimonadaceae bacterium]
MLRNYFLIAIAVLKRRKFFTFISLFGISFTLTILMVLTAFFDHLVAPGYPELNRDKCLYVSHVEQRNSKEQGMNSGPASYYFLDHYCSKLKTPAKLAISSLFTSTNTYVNNQKLVIDVKYTNDQFWDVLRFTFLEGKPYSKDQIDRHDRVAVITEGTKKSYFGDVASVVGKTIITDNEQYRVIGVVKGVPVTLIYSYADMFLPHTLSKVAYDKKSLNGMFFGVLLPDNENDLDKLKAEFNQMASKIKPPEPEYDEFITYADPYFINFSREAFGGKTSTGMATVVIILSLLAFFFMLLPTLNLVNINLSRMMERASEIGVRKAFGASSATLVYQFLVENLILTFLGGIIGLILTSATLYFLNTSGLIQNMDLKINLTVLGFSFLACLVFGLFSGVYPAFRMSRLAVVTALKS